MFAFVASVSVGLGPGSKERTGFRCFTRAKNAAEPKNEGAGSLLTSWKRLLQWLAECRSDRSFRVVFVPIPPKITELSDSRKYVCVRRLSCLLGTESSCEPIHTKCVAPTGSKPKMSVRSHLSQIPRWETLSLPWGLGFGRKWQTVVTGSLSCKSNSIPIRTRINQRHEVTWEWSVAQ